MKNTAAAVVALALGCSSTALAAQEVAFVTCPIVQDTPTVPCWLVEHNGEELYMGVQVDSSSAFSPPSLGHKVLVEGTLTDRVECGARVIDPIKISIMPELSPECDEMRMAQPGVDISFVPRRPPGPSAGRLAYDTFEPEPDPEPPYEPQSFNIQFPFDELFTFSRAPALLDITDYAELTQARTVEVMARRGATRLDDGTLLMERSGIASQRAEQLIALLRHIGLTEAEFIIRADDTPVEGGPESRWTEVRIVP